MLEIETRHNGDELIFNFNGVEVDLDVVPHNIQWEIVHQTRIVSRQNNSPRAWIPQHWESNFCTQREGEITPLARQAREFADLVGKLDYQTASVLAPAWWVDFLIDVRADMALTRAYSWRTPRYGVHHVAVAAWLRRPEPIGE